MRRFFKNEDGFSLVEVIIVMAIMGILAGFAYIGSEFLRKEKVSNASRRLLSDIQKARVDALTSAGTTTNFMGSGIRFTANSYVAFLFDDTVTVDSLYEKGEEEPASIVTTTLSSPLVISLPSSSYSVLIYNRFGLPAIYAWDTTGTYQSLSSQVQDIVIQDVSLNVARCVEVSANTIREGIWNGSTCALQ